MDIYKEDVLEAIETEPLSFGEWIKTDWDSLEHNEGCKVCVIGGILRKAGVNPLNISSVADDIVDDGGGIEPYGYGLDVYLPTKWPNALSFVWEGLRDIPVKEAKVHMHDWVEENVPDEEVLFSIN